VLSSAVLGESGAIVALRPSAPPPAGRPAAPPPATTRCPARHRSGRMAANPASGCLPGLQHLA